MFTFTIIAFAFVIAIIAICISAQNETIQDMNRRLNMLSKSLELLEQDFRDQELAHQNALKQIEQINE